MPPPSAPRRDKLRNRERLLDAARRLFTERGSQVPLDEVAAAAGVSRTTLHRHFTSRVELAAALFVANVEAIEQRASDLTDVSDGIVSLYHFALDMQLQTPALSRALAPSQADQLAVLSTRTGIAFAPLVRRGLAAGVMHPEVGVRDILLTLPMAAAAVMEDIAAGREPMLVQIHALLHRSLFTTDPP